MLEKLGEWGGNANLRFILVISTHIHTDHQRGVNQVLFRKVVCLSPAMFSFILAICGEAFLSFFFVFAPSSSGNVILQSQRGCLKILSWSNGWYFISIYDCQWLPNPQNIANFMLPKFSTLKWTMWTPKKMKQTSSFLNILHRWSGVGGLGNQWSTFCFVQLQSECFLLNCRLWCLEGFLVGNKNQAIVVGFAMLSIQNFDGFMWSNSKRFHINVTLSEHFCHSLLPFILSTFISFS